VASEETKAQRQVLHGKEIDSPTAMETFPTWHLRVLVGGGVQRLVAAQLIVPSALQTQVLHPVESVNWSPTA
jgi:hypothetical protein